MGDGKEALVDCDAGRALGCASFCCRLIVRLGPGERDPSRPDEPAKHCVDKDRKDGLCVLFDRETQACTAWDRRPTTCREYDCNGDPLLQVVLRDGYHSLTALIIAPHVPPADHVAIPRLDRPQPLLPPTHLLRRFRERAPDARPGEADLGAACRMRALREEIAKAIGEVRACSTCARGEPPPVGRWEGGRCCAHSTDTLFDDATLDALRASGTTERELSAPSGAEGGCAFRGPVGCSLAPAHRPNACVAYLCPALESELEARGDLAAVRALTRELEAETARHAALVALRQAAETIEALI